MAGGLFTRLKTWVMNENLLYSDLNAEFNNIINNVDAIHLTGYSATVPQMKLQVTPGGLGTESLAASISDEIARLRYVIQRIIGSDVTYWYEAPLTDLTSLNDSVNQINRIPRNRLVSGAVDAKNFQAYLIPNGAAASVTIKATATPLVAYIAGIRYQFTADIVIAGLSLASGDTCAATAAALSCDGEQDSLIQIGTLTAGVSALAGTGKQAAFKTAGGEFFVSQVTATTLKHAYRGYFLDSTGIIVPRGTIASLAAITLLKMTWVFLKSDGTGFVTYTQPTSSNAAPTGPGIGDMWFNILTEVWAQYTGSIWVDVACIPVGVCAQDAAACVAARPIEIYAIYDPFNTIELEIKDAGALNVGAKELGSKISVAGTIFDYDQGFFNVSSTQVDTGGIFVNGNTVYIYIKDSGVPTLSLIPPYRREVDLFGYYHPYAPWRCIGFSVVDATPKFTALNFYTPINTSSLLPVGVPLAFSGTVLPNGYLWCDGVAKSRTTYLNLFAAIGKSCGQGDTSTTFNPPDFQGQFLRGVDNAAGRDPNKASRTAMATGGNTGNAVGSVQTYSTALPVIAAFTAAGTTGGESATHVHRAFTAFWIDGGTNILQAGGSVGMTTALDTNANTTDHTHNYTGSITGGDNETRPINAYVNYIIKF